MVGDGASEGVVAEGQVGGVGLYGEDAGGGAGIQVETDDASGGGLRREAAVLAAEIEHPSRGRGGLEDLMHYTVLPCGWIMANRLGLES